MLNSKILMRIGLNSLLGLALVFIWSRFVDLNQIMGIIKTVDLKYASLIFVFIVISGVLRGFRLKILLTKYKIPLKDLITLNFLSQFLSFMIPIRAGEITKSVYLNSQYDIPLAKTVVWIFVDRFLDLWVVLLIISTFTFFVSTTLPVTVIQLALLLFLGMSAATVLIIKSEKQSKNLLKILSKFFVLKKIQDWFLKFSTTIVEGFEVLRLNPVSWVLVIISSLLATISDSLVWFFVLFSLGINFGLDKSILGNSLAALTFLIPAAPGYVGSAEASGLAVFSGILGLENNTASAMTVVFHLLTLLSLLIVGIFSIYFLKFDLGLVWKKIRKEN